MPDRDPEPPPEVVRYANELVWKDASFDVIDKEYEEQYPVWMRMVVEKLQLLHNRGEGLLPDLRAFGNKTVAVFSDYGGEHRGSKFVTYSLLVTGLDLAFPFQDLMKEIRDRYGLESTEIAFKRFREGRMRAALPEYLKALNNLLPGLLFTLVVDRQIKSLFGADTRKGREIVQQQLEDAELGTRKPKVNEKALRVTHLAGMLAGLLAHDGQKVYWMTDDDSIAEGEERARDTLALFAWTLQMYTRQGVSFDLVSGGTTFEERHTDTLDLLSATDIVAGCLSEYMSRKKGAAGEDTTVKEGSEKVLQWMPAQGIGLRKVTLIVRPAGGGISVGVAKFKTDVPQDIREVLIDMSKP